MTSTPAFPAPMGHALDRSGAIRDATYPWNQARPVEQRMTCPQGCHSVRRAGC